MYERRNVWSADTWTRELLWYSRAVQAMQVLPIENPVSWKYQGAIHGIRGVTPPKDAPWESCQHQTWFFPPWHRMYLLYFERIVRNQVKLLGGPEGWTLPYWDYGNPSQSALPAAFRERKREDGSPNPLFVDSRKPYINAGGQLLPDETSSKDAMSKTVYTSSWWRTGFGGEETGFHHGGGDNGAIENQPHNIVHVAIGGLMQNPNTAALDPIFWLHHANIDRLWETWRRSLDHDPYPPEAKFRDQPFEFVNASGKPVTIAVAFVLDMKKLDYTYQSLGEQVADGPVADEEVVMSETGSSDAAYAPAMVGRSADSMIVTVQGGEISVPVGPTPHGADAAQGPTHWRLELADVVGTVNPGVVYGVHVYPPGGDPDRDADRVGLVSFFGIELTEDGAHPLRYTFDFTETMERLASSGSVEEVEVALWPLREEAVDDLDGDQPTITIGTVAVHAGG